MKVQNLIWVTHEFPILFFYLSFNSSVVNVQLYISFRCAVLWFNPSTHHPGLITSALLKLNTYFIHPQTHKFSIFNHARSLKVYYNFHIDVHCWFVSLNEKENIVLVDLKLLIRTLLTPFYMKRECSGSLLYSQWERSYMQLVSIAPESNSYNIIGQNMSLIWNAFSLIL